jgi:histidinol phosphatase-like enzyme (inositol monophosphatase family)
MPDYKSRLDFAVRAARIAGEIALEYFRREDLAVDLKADDTPVTVADRRAETKIRELIVDSFADDGILGEEMPEREGKNGFRWILDPIDGTKSFIHGVPLFGTLIGLEFEGKSVLGVIRVPVLDECVYAAKGHGAWYRWGDRSPVPAKVSQNRTLAESLFVTSEVTSFEETHRRAAFDRMIATARLSRNWGDCYGYMLVATGRADVMVDPVMCSWDAAPMLPIFQEAGGTFTDWKGNSTIHAGEGVATNGLLLKEVLRTLGE